MGCDCGKPKCDGHCGVSPAVLQINNPSECVLFHRVEVPASMGDSKTNPPKNGEYKNVLLYYEADQTSWLYSSDGIPQKLVNGITNYEEAINLPQINGVTLLGNKSLGDLGITGAIDDAVAVEKTEREAADADLQNQIDALVNTKQDKLTAGNNIAISGNTISAIVPTKTSDLTNDGATGASVYIEESDITPSELSGEGEFITLEGTTDCSALDIQLNGNATQTTYSGKNLWDGEFGQGVTYSPSMTNRITTTQSPLLTSGQTYTVSAFNLPSGLRYAVALYINPAYPGSNPGTAVYDSSWKTSESFTFTAEGDYYFSVVMGKTDNSNITPSDVANVNFQLEKGSTATDYEPYVGGTPAPNPEFPQPISTVTGENVVKVVGKNLFNITPRKTGDGYYNSNTGVYVDNSYDDSVVTYETTENGLTATILTAWKGLFFASTPLQAGTQYHFKWDVTSTGNVRASVYTLDSSFIIKRRIGNYTTNPTSSNANITLQDGEMYIGLWIGSNNANDVLTISQPQLEQGSTATSYQAYTAQDYAINLGTIELANIGTYQDRIYKEGEKWYVEKQIGKVVLNGTEDGWGRSGVANANNYYCTGVTDAANVPVDNKGAISPTLQSFSISQMFATTSEYGVALYNNAPSQIRLCFPIDELSTLAQVKTWLSAHPTTLYYALATPTTTEITNQTLIDQLEALAGAHGYDGVTNIMSAASGLPAILSVSTYTDSVIPSATRTRAGIVRIGDGIDVDDCGTISVSAQKAPTVFTMQYTTGSPDSFLPGWQDHSIVEKIGVTNGTPAWGIYKTSLSSSGSDPNYPVTFLNEKTGDVISPEALYNLLLSGEDVVLNHVPLGVKIVSEWADDTAYVDGIRLTKFVESSPYASVGFGGTAFIETFIPIYGENDGITIPCQLGFSISGYTDGDALVYDQMVVRGINVQTE